MKNILTELCMDHFGQEWGMLMVPTEEVWTPKINGAQIPLRIWRALTCGNLQVDAHVLSILARYPEATEALQAELPPYFKRTAAMQDSFEIHDPD